MVRILRDTLTAQTFSLLLSKVFGTKRFYSFLYCPNFIKDSNFYIISCIIQALEYTGEFEYVH